MSSIKEMLNEFVELQILYLVPDLEKREVLYQVLADEDTDAWFNWSSQMRMAAKLWNWKMSMND